MKKLLFILLALTLTAFVMPPVSMAQNNSPPGFSFTIGLDQPIQASVLYAENVFVINHPNVIMDQSAYCGEAFTRPGVMSWTPSIYNYAPEYIDQMICNPGTIYLYDRQWYWFGMLQDGNLVNSSNRLLRLQSAGDL